MRGPLLISLSAILVCSTSLSDEAGQRLSVEFETAIANIAPRATDQPVHFPDLTFALRGETHCHAPDSTASVSVSIADSRLTIAPDPDRQGLIEETMRVPHKQLGPIVVDNFCLAGESESVQYLELEGALSAHLSLRCSSENQNSISYLTSALNVTIQCQNEEPELPDQDESAAE
jgi:hypothetical protein